MTAKAENPASHKFVIGNDDKAFSASFDRFIFKLCSKLS